MLSLCVDAALLVCAIAAFLGDSLAGRGELATALYLCVMFALFVSRPSCSFRWLGGLLAFAKVLALLLSSGGAFDLWAFAGTSIGAVAVVSCGFILNRYALCRATATGIDPAQPRTEKRPAASDDEVFAAMAQNDKLYRTVYSQTHVALWTQDLSKLRETLARSQQREGDSSPIVDLRTVSRFINTMDVNRAAIELMGAEKRADLLGRFDRFMPSTKIDAQAFLRAMKFGERLEGKGRITRCDGHQIDVVFGIIFQKDSDVPDRAMVGMLDVTGKRQHARQVAMAKAELDRLFRAAAIDAVSASIAHEINQPLGAMLMNAQTSLRLLKQQNLSAAIAAIERTISNIEQATEIVQKVRFQTATHFKPFAAADVGATVQETLRLMRSEFEAHNVAAAAVLDDGLPPVALDRTELLQVLVNISRNAIQAMFDTPVEQRELAITAALTDDSIRILISDTGCGFSSSLQPRMFDTFFTTKSNGTGLGLSICKSIVEGRGGRLTAYSRTEGGATFSVILPILPPEQTPPGLQRLDRRGATLA